MKMENIRSADEEDKPDDIRKDSTYTNRARIALI